MNETRTMLCCAGLVLLAGMTSCGGGGGGAGDGQASNREEEAESSTIDWLPNGTSVSIRLDSIAEKTENGAAVNPPDYEGMYRQILLNVGANATGNVYLDGLPVSCRINFRQSGTTFVCEITATSPALVVTLTQGSLSDSTAHAGYWVYQYQDMLNGTRIMAAGTSASLQKEAN